MTKLLDQAFELLGQMPAKTQDDVARALIGMAEVIELDDIEPEHRAAVLEGMAQAQRGEFAAGSASEIVTNAFRRRRP